jgi:hypothetical protein
MPFGKDMNRLRAKRRYWEKRLAQVVDGMSSITVSRTYHVCGNPKCKRCREEGGKHGPLLYATYKDEARKTHTLYVPRKLEYLADEAHRKWLEFKEIGKKIGDINREILILRIKKGREK